MFTLEELEIYLKNNNADFEIIHHEYPIYSVKDAAGYFDIRKATPTLIVETEQGLIVLIVSSQRGRLNFEELKKECGFSEMKLADKRAIMESIGCPAGAVPLPKRPMRPDPTATNRHLPEPQPQQALQFARQWSELEARSKACLLPLTEWQPTREQTLAAPRLLVQQRHGDWVCSAVLLP